MYDRNPLDIFSTDRLTPGVQMLILVTIASGLLQVLTGGSQGFYTTYLALTPEAATGGRLWQFVTYMFLHGDFFHIFFNLLIFFFLGPTVERCVGTKNFVIVYLLCGVVGGVGWLVFSGLAAGASCVGASGAVYGVIGMFAGLFPLRPITLLLFLVFPITVTARTLAALSALFMLAMIASGGGSSGGIAHTAHLFGGVAGYIMAVTTFKHADMGIVADLGGLFGTLRARLRRRRFRVVRGGATPEATPEEVDRILDKIIEQGLGSLSRTEKETLDKASKK